MKKVLMIMAVAACVSMTSCGGDKKNCDNENCPNAEQCTECTECNGQCGAEVVEEATETEPAAEVTDAQVEEAQVVEGAAEN